MATKDRGFASMDPKRVSEIASMGGKKAHTDGTAHEWTREEAQAAGRKGGLAGAAKRRAKAATNASVVEPGDHAAQS